MEEEKISKGTVFDYRVVGPFTTATVAHANAFSLIPHEQTKIYYPDVSDETSQPSSHGYPFLPLE